MSLLLKNRDYVADGNGGVAVVQDGEALLNEALFRLTAQRGSFSFLPDLGSRMGELRREKPSASELDGVTVTGARVREEAGVLAAEVSLLWQGAQLPVQVWLEG